MSRIVILILGLFLNNLALAQNKPLACQVDAKAGLQWEGGRWKTKSYVAEKFILVLEDNKLTKASVGKALNNPFENQITCKEFHDISCSDFSGSHLFLNIKNLKGAISATFGAINEGQERDSVTVAAFSCTPF